MKDILPYIAEDLAAGKFTIESNCEGSESVKEVARSVVRDHIMKYGKTMSNIPERYPSPLISAMRMIVASGEFQSTCRMLRNIPGGYRKPPMVASPYCNTGYLTADRRPSIYFISPGAGKVNLSKRYPTEFDPADIVDHPNQLIKKMLSEEEKKGMDDLYKRLHERAKLS